MTATDTPILDTVEQAHVEADSAKAPPDREEVERVWAGCSPVTASKSARDFLDRRGLDPALIAKLDLARVLVETTPVYPWMESKPFEWEGETTSRSWRQTGHILILPLSDETGSIRSLKARCIYPIPRTKTRNPRGYGLKGLAFTGPTERNYLGLSGAPGTQPPLVDGWVVVEGEMDYLTWATKLAQAPKEAPLYLLLGVYSGSINAEWAKALTRRGVIPAGASLTECAQKPAVLLRLHGDKAGDAYAVKVGQALRLVQPAQAFSKLSPHPSGWDENAAHANLRLALDPLVGMEPWEPPPLEGPPTEVRPRREVFEGTDPTAEAARRRAYVVSALSAASLIVATSKEGERDNVLYREAARTARFKDETDCFSRNEWRDVLTAAARQAGLGAAEITNTLESAYSTTLEGRWGHIIPPPSTIVPRKSKTAKPPTKTQLAKPSEVANPAIGETGEAIEGATDDTFEEDDFASLPPDDMPHTHMRASVWIDVGEPDLEVQHTTALGALGQRPDVFSRNAELVQVTLDHEGVPAIRALKSTTVRERLSSEAFCYCDSMNKKTGEMERRQVSVPMRMAQALVDRQCYPAEVIRGLRRMARHPVLAPFYAPGGKVASHEIITRSGYTDGAAVYLAPAVEVSLSLPVHPTKEDALAALKVIEEPFRDFQFECSGGLAATISLLLALLARPCIVSGFVPYYLVTASTPGTGKGTLLSLVQGIALGRTEITPTTLPANPDEEAKLLMSWGLSGRSGLVCFDNIESGSTIGSPGLDAVLTSGSLEGRVLGGNTSAEVSLGSLTFAGTGNNIAIKGDLARRLLPIPLVAPPGDLAKRVWVHPDIESYVLGKRAELLGAVFTILRAYSLRVDDWKAPAPLPSFRDWSRWCRDPLLWLGAVDFVAESRGSVKTSDPMLSGLTSLLSILYKISPSQTITIRSLKKLWQESEDGDKALDAELCEAVSNLGWVDNSGRWKQAAVRDTLGIYQDRDLGGLTLSSEVRFSRWIITSSAPPF